ncbi:MAG TPA: hemerythrin domain-containing protein [Candidatus Polarisedimenticolia bacterium]|nr:hemerythrin domain-containing protein [Candidatus Polarisedimenticolia bacterium]
MNREPTSGATASRRTFLHAGGLAGLGFLAMAGNKPPGSPARTTKPADQEKEEEEGVAPPEDLMREHGVLKRVMLVYEEAVRRIEGRRDLPPDSVRDGATIIRTFIEDYHEKLEEEHLFPRFEKAGKLTDLTAVLRAQHQAGRRVTEEITQLATAAGLKDASSAGRLKELMRQFVRMYGPHEAREDTVLFPALRSIVSPHEFAALGEDFEKKEHQLFGAEGFERMVDRVATIEKTLGIYDLGQFTPK